MAINPSFVRKNGQTKVAIAATAVDGDIIFMGPAGIAQCKCRLYSVDGAAMLPSLSTTNPVEIRPIPEHAFPMLTR